LSAASRQSSPPPVEPERLTWPLKPALPDYCISAIHGAMRRLLARLAGARHEWYADTFVVEEAGCNLGLKAPGSLPVLDRP